MSVNDQKSIFLSAEGDAWFLRNREKLNHTRPHPVLNSLEKLGLHPKKILEIGCSNGERLWRLQQRFGASCYGIEPSMAAVEDAKKFSDINVQQGTADHLPFPDQEFDLVIFGFCLYLCDPKDLFKIAHQADRVLAPGGFLAILDFLPNYSYRNPYSHRPGVFSHKMEWQKMFSWNPAYGLLDRSFILHNDKSFHPDHRTSVDILKKDPSSAFPSRDS